MSIIAVAGGTGGVGRTIIEKLLESEFDVVVLTRSVRSKENTLLEKILNDLSGETKL